MPQRLSIALSRPNPIRAKFTLAFTMLVLIAASLASIESPASANTVSWLAAVDGNWNDGAKWSGGNPPGPSDDAVIAATGSPYTVTLNVSPSVKSLQLGGDATVLAEAQSLTTTDGVTVAASGTLLLRSGGSIAGNLSNAGKLIAQGNPNQVTGLYTTSAGSLLRVQCAGVFAVAQLTFANGFTNHGTIELTSTTNFFLGAVLTVTSGTLTNASDGTITSLFGNGGGPRLIEAQVANQGALSSEWPLDVNKANVAHTNSGSITLTTVNGTLTVTQSASGSFTNLPGATYSLAPQTSLLIDNGSFQHDPMTSSGTGELVVRNCTVTGVTLEATSAPFVLRGGNTVDNIANAGKLIAQGNPNHVTGLYTTSAGSLLRVQCAGVFAVAQLTFANGFTNHGTIELTSTTNFFLGAVLTVTSGTLTNASDGTITSLFGNGGGPRLIEAQVANQGALSSEWPLDVNKANVAHTNSGSITLLTPSGGLTVTQSASGSFTNQSGATYALGNLTTFLIDNGSFQYDPVSTSGTGELVVRNCTVTGVTLEATSAPFVLRGGNTVDNIANAGKLIAQGNPNQVTGLYTTSAGSLLRVQCAGVFAVAQLTFANGFTNHGTIELTSTTNFFLGAVLTVTSGTLTNASDGTITSLFGNGGGPRLIEAKIANQGAINGEWPLDVNKANVAHTNSGSITLTTVNGTLTVTQSAPGSFTNLPGATYSLAPQTSLLIDNGSFQHDPMTSSGTGELVVRNCTVTGVTQQATSAPFVLRGGNTVDNVANAGPVIAQGNGNQVTGSYTSSTGSLLRVQCAGVFAEAQLTLANGFTNHGTIELTSTSNYFLGDRLTVSSGALTNAADGAITSLFGNGGGGRIIMGVLDNFGSIETHWPLTFSGGPATNQPSGSVSGDNTLDVSAVVYVDNGSTRPGSSPGILTIQQNDTRGATSALHIEIAGYGLGNFFDRLVVPGTVTLNGTLSITRPNGFTPSLGDSFAVVTAGTVLGTFTTVSGKTIIPDLLEWQVKYKADRVDLIAGTPPPDNAPTAVNDSAATGEDLFVDIPVRANDTDVDGDSVHVVAGSFIGPAHGSAGLNLDETVRYTPAPNYSGADSFRYVITDNRTGLDTALVRITVTPLNDPPYFAQPLTDPDDTLRITQPFDKKIALIVEARDVDPGSVVTLTSGPLPPGATMTLPLPRVGNPAKSTLSWVPIRAQMGTWVFDFFATDDSAATKKITMRVEVIDNPTPTLLARFSAHPGVQGIELRWRLGDPAAFQDLVLERSERPAGAWTRLALEWKDDEGGVLAIDRDASPGREYAYRLTGTLEGSSIVLGSVTASAIAERFAIEHVAPSPTRGAARIAYSLARESNVRLSLCDVLGREMTVLESGVQHAGRHEASWSGRIGNAAAPAGVYFVKLEAAGQRFVERMVVAP